MFKNVGLVVFAGLILCSCAETPNNSEEFQPYLENSRHLQIPQWEDENWYVEDWTSKEPAMKIIKGFYNADILRAQTKGVNGMPVIVVGPNFYHLSGLDKRRVMTLIDSVYNITANGSGAFFLKDWNTEKYIGVYDENGLRLH